MRLRESLTLDRLINERRKLLSQDNFTRAQMEQRAEALTILIKARHDLDQLMHVNWSKELNEPCQVGDVNIDLAPTK